MNILSGERLICGKCGYHLYDQTITQTERKRREKERTGFCKICNQIVLGVPLEVLKTNFLACYKGKYTKKERSRISLIIGNFERTINSYRQDGYDLVCNICSEGIKSKQIPAVSKGKRANIHQNNIKKHCKVCGFENFTLSSTCPNCGIEFKEIEEVKQDSRYIPKEVIGQVWLRYEGKCVQCGSSINLQLDHIIPYSKGGATSLDNLQLLCKKCNMEKSNKI